MVTEPILLTLGVNNFAQDILVKTTYFLAAQLRGFVKCGRVRPHTKKVVSLPQVRFTLDFIGQMRFSGKSLSKSGAFASARAGKGIRDTRD